MNKKILFGSILFVLVALISIGCGERLITVLNPAITSKMIERVPLAPRSGTLEGKTIYLVDLSEFNAMNQAYASYFPGEPPARATVQVAALPKQVRVEIDAIAVVGD